MGYYLKWSAHSGSSDTNTQLLQITGITGTMTKVEFRVKEDSPLYLFNQAQYIYDVRRLEDSTTTGAGASYLLKFSSGSVDATGTSGFKINSFSVSASAMFEFDAEDYLEFNTSIAPSGGCIAIGARHNEVQHFYGLTISEITITDANGAHTIDMSDSGGTGTSLTSTDDALTATLFNFPVDDSQWVFYSTGIEQAVGLVTDTNTALATTASKAKAVGIATETNTALALSTAITQAVGLASETNAAPTVASSKTKAVGLSAETNAALSTTAAKAMSTGQAIDVNTALSIAASKAKAVNLATETNTAFALASAKAKSTGLATETNTAFSVTAITPGGATVGIATETNTALSTTASKVKAVGVASDTSTALPATAAKTVTVGQASTLDSAAQLAILKSLSVGLAQTTDTAIPLSIAQVVEVGLASEDNTALALSVGFPLASWVYTVPVEQRIISVSAEQRSYTVPVEQRVIEVTP